MRLDPAEFSELPLPAALLDHRRQTVVATPEWHGWMPGDVVYFAGHGHLAVSGGEPGSPVLAGVLDDLLTALGALQATLEADDAARLRVLLAGLRIVAGQPIGDDDRGTSDEVLELARLAIEARVVPPIAVELRPVVPALEVPAPAAVALAVVQLAVNVSRHEHEDAAETRAVRAVTVRVSSGPSFQIEWASERASATAVHTHRHVQRRHRWGLGYVRLAADALGGTALPPAPSGRGRASVGFGVGSRNLALPLCCEEAAVATRTTRSWDQEHDPNAPDGGDGDPRLLEHLRRAAQAQAGQIVTHAYHTARAIPGTERVWFAMPPESGDDRIRDALRGLDHEQALLRAPEPYGSRVHALNVLLRAGLGDRSALTTCYRQDWLRRFPAAMRAFGLAAPALRDAAGYPDPQVAAWLLAEYRGHLDVDATGAVWFSPATPSDARLNLLGADAGGRVRLAGGITF
ncbi:MAG: hypothetical protein WAM30_19220 [Candidatus Dormiibacterota bacterium]